MSAGYQNGQHNTERAAPSADHPAGWSDLRDDVRQLGDVAVERGYGLVEAAREQVNTYVAQRKDDAAQSVDDFAKALRESGKGLEQQPNVKAFFDSAAEGLEQLSGSIRARSFEDFYGELEHVARRRPAAFAVATFVAGFFAARFIRSSAHPAHAIPGREAFEADRRPGGRTPL
ncbi:hypothetical protein [Methylobacterium sp. JK268]